MARTPIHPGEILSDELTELQTSVAALARILRVPTNRISQILKGQRAITVDTALRLSLISALPEIEWVKSLELGILRRAPLSDASPSQGEGRWGRVSQAGARVCRACLHGPQVFDLPSPLLTKEGMKGMVGIDPSVPPRPCPCTRSGSVL